MKPEHGKYILENIGKRSAAEIARELNLKERAVRRFLQYEKTRGKPAATAETLKPTNEKQNIPSIFMLITIAVLGILAYANSLRGEFLFDDKGLIVLNPFVKDPSQWTKFFTQSIWQGVGIQHSFYRPLQMLTYLADHALWGMNPVGYHLTNMIVHCLVALVIFWFIALLFGDKRLAFLTGAFFVIHPIHTEAVSYIAGRSDPLAALFLILSLVFYIRLETSKKTATLVLFSVSYALALLSKEYGLILSLLILVYAYSFKKKLNRRAFACVLGVSIAYFFARSVLPPSKANVMAGALFERLPGFFVAVAQYFSLLLFPRNLHMEYGAELFPWAHPITAIGMLIVSGSLSYVILKKQNDRVLLFSVLWFFAALIPSSNIFPINAYMAEHWLYVPSIGFFVLLSRALIWLHEKKDLKVASVVILLGLASFYLVSTVRQNGYWHDPFTFYEKTLRQKPDDVRILNNMGLEYKALGQMDKAKDIFERALKFDPREEQTYNNLASLYADLGQNKKAVELFLKGVEINPKSGLLHENLSATYFNMGQYALAVEYCDKALALGRPVNAQLLRLLEPHRSH